MNMNSTPQKTSKKKVRIKTRVFVPLVFVIAILIITYIFPRQGSFNYTFTEGRPWQYGLLTAPFDFPIYKPADQLKIEQDSILQFYEPYFVINESVKVNALANFDADVNLDKRLSELPPEYKIYIRKRLNEIYDNGIMRSEDYDRITASRTGALRLKKGNVAESRSASTFFTIRSAYESVLNETPEGIYDNILKAANINEYIQENIIYDAETSEKAREEFVQQVDISRGMVQQGQRIIDQGEIVDSRTFNILSSLRQVSEERSGGAAKGTWRVIGQFILVLFMFLSF